MPTLSMSAFGGKADISDPLDSNILLTGEALAAPQAKKSTLYVDKIERGTDEVFLTYSYQTGFPPDFDDVLQVALAQCRRLGFHNAVRSADPTLRQCLATAVYGGVCMRESATDNFCCTVANNPDWNLDPTQAPCQLPR
jgi:hypothetical protein